MNLKTWVPMGVAIVLGGIAAKTGRDMLMHRDNTPKTVVVNVSKVVIAKEDIPAGTALKPTDLATNNVAESSVTPGSFHDGAPLVNRVVTMPLLKGQPILENMLAPLGSSKGLPAIVPDGMRAATLEINEVSGVAGLLALGCRVDIVTSLSGEDGKMISRTVARNLLIIAMGHRMGEPGKDEAPDPAPPRTVTLLVTPREAELIDLAAHNGNPRLVLRGSRDLKSDLNDESEGVTLAELRGTKATRRSGIRQMITEVFEPITHAIATAQQQQAGKGLFGDSGSPATQPAGPGQYRQVTVIRNTKEQAVQVEVQHEPARQNFAKPDVEPAIPGN